MGRVSEEGCDLGRDRDARCVLPRAAGRCRRSAGPPGMTLQATCHTDSADQPKPSPFNPALRQSAEDLGYPANAMKPTSARALSFPRQTLGAT